MSYGYVNTNVYGKKQNNSGITNGLSDLLKIRETLQMQILGYFTNFRSKIPLVWAISEGGLDEEDFDFPHLNVFKRLREQSLSQNENVDLLLALENEKMVHLFASYSSYGNQLMTSQAFKDAVQRLKMSTSVQKLYDLFVYANQSLVDHNYDGINAVYDDLIRFITLRGNSGFKHVSKLVDSVYDMKKDIFHVKSKFPSLNQLVYSYKSGDLHVFAARPGVGKTTILLNEAVSMAKNGIPVGFITLEVPAIQCVRRITSLLTGISHGELYDVEKFKSAMESSGLRNMNIYFYEDYSIDWVNLILKIRKIVASGVRVIFIDQLSHIKHNEKAYSKTDAIEKTVRALRSLALELNIIIILAVQINRSALTSEEPELEHIKDSGSIEEASQLVVMLQRKEGALKAFVRKASHGKLGEFEIAFLADICRVEEAAYAD